MEAIVIVGLLYVALAAFAGYGMARPRCPSWVITVVAVLSGLVLAGMYAQIQEQQLGTITAGDVLDMSLPGSFLIAALIAYMIRPSRPNK